MNDKKMTEAEADKRLDDLLPEMTEAEALADWKRLESLLPAQRRAEALEWDEEVTEAMRWASKARLEKMAEEERAFNEMAELCDDEN